MKLGDRIKLYEEVSGCKKKLLPCVPILARLDGKAFHSFCKGLNKPFDAKFQQCMETTAICLIEETHALLGYTQSDEITLLWYKENVDSQIFMDGKINKMNSILASMASVFFTRAVNTLLPEKSGQKGLFDCRVFNVPTKQEACNCFLWREQDAVRNSIAGLAQAHFSHKQLHGKDSVAMQDMLHEKGINWNDLPNKSKRGMYLRRRTTERLYTPKEIDKLPEKHEARTNPNLMITRTSTVRLELPPLGKITNRVEAIFNDDVPEMEVQLPKENKEEMK